MNICLPFQDKLRTCKFLMKTNRRHEEQPLLFFKYFTQYWVENLLRIVRMAFSQGATVRNFSLNIRSHDLFSSYRHFKSACDKHLQSLSNIRRVYSRPLILKKAGNPNETCITTLRFRLSSLCSRGLRSS